MKATSKTVKTASKTSTLSHAKRSAISRKAAGSAWAFMKSRAYQAIKNSSRTDAAKRKAIEALKARRAA